jgi:hypothetical protein
VTPAGTDQPKVADDPGYHESCSGWVDEVTTGFAGTEFDAAADGGTSDWAGPVILIDADWIEERILVPSPSFARTAESEKSKVASPCFFARKAIETISFSWPTTPGFGMPPLNETDPSELEKEGSSTQSGNIDDPFVTEITSSMSAGNRMVALALLTDSPSVLTRALIDTMFPADRFDVDGEKERLAACIARGDERNAAIARIARVMFRDLLLREI